MKFLLFLALMGLAGCGYCRLNLAVKSLLWEASISVEHGGDEDDLSNKGVSWNSIGKNWKAQISNEGKNNYIGVFNSEEEAALAYDRAALRLRGEYARVNFLYKEVRHLSPFSKEERGSRSQQQHHCNSGGNQGR